MKPEENRRDKLLLSFSTYLYIYKYVKGTRAYILCKYIIDINESVWERSVDNK